MCSVVCRHGVNSTAAGVNAMRVRCYVTDLVPLGMKYQNYFKSPSWSTVIHFDAVALFAKTPTVPCNDVHDHKSSLCSMQVGGSDILTWFQTNLRYCRARKVVSYSVTLGSHALNNSLRLFQQKCIPGLTKRCERCATLGVKDCIYLPTKRRQVGETLRMGEACDRCRSVSLLFTDAC